ncbi:MAG: CopG family transcriptional regulator [Coriobacteriia bacterium]|nr:CopG family transcriptional regulator [Coriobacteriia bacterium]
MIRTQISLSREDYDAAKREAARLGISLAEYFRRALKAVLPVSDLQPWMAFAGMVDSGDPAASDSVDDVVYAHED